MEYEKGFKMKDRVYLDDNIFYIENYITPEHLDIIQKECLLQDGWEREGNFWAKHNFDHNRNFQEIMMNFYKPMTEELFNDQNNIANFNMLLQKYTEDCIASNAEWSLQPHTDRWDSKNGEEPYSLNSKYVTGGFIIYFNDNYQGGELVYVNKNITIKPKSGMLVYHSGNEEYRHGVKRVIGERYMLTGFIYEKDHFNAIHRGKLD